MSQLKRLPMFALAALASCTSIVFGDLQKVGSGRPDAGETEPGDDDDDPRTTPEGGTPESGTTTCDRTKPFGAAVALEGPVNTAAAHETSPSLTADELTIVFQRTVGLDGGNLLMATRSSRDVPFGNVRELVELSTSGVSFGPSITGDGLIIFWTELVNNNNHMNVFTAERTTPQGPFTRSRSLDGVNTLDDEFNTFITSNGAELWLTSDRTGQVRLYRSVRDAVGEYGPPALFTELGVPGIGLSADGLTAFFVSNQTGGAGMADIWFANRPALTAPFGAPINGGAANGPQDDSPSWLSPDGCRLYMTSARNGKDDLFVATRLP